MVLFRGQFYVIAPEIIKKEKITEILRCADNISAHRRHRKKQVFIILFQKIDQIKAENFRLKIKLIKSFFV